MRPDPASPLLVALELLARADVLATAAAEAIAEGEDRALLALLDEREEVVAQAIQAAHAVAASRPDRTVTSQLESAMAQALARGTHATVAAIRARDQVLAALAALDARQHASHEYQQAPQVGTINVVL